MSTKMKTRSKSRRTPLPKSPRAPLPKSFRGADVVRGLPMDNEKYERLLDGKGLSAFDASADLFIVVEDRALDSGLHRSPIVAFRDKKDALRLARANGNGNVDQRVLRITEQTLVVATENDGVDA